MENFFCPPDKIDEFPHCGNFLRFLTLLPNFKGKIGINLTDFMQLS